MPFSWATWQRESAGRAFEASTRLPTPAALTILTALMAVSWAASYAAGGSYTSVPHLFYLPLVLASARFSWRGALIASVIAGLLAGPLLPFAVETGQMQGVANWVSRLLAFAMVGGLVAWLTNQSRHSVLSKVHDGRLAHDLRRALRDGEIVVHYQPVVDMATNRVLGVEALARWRHPTRGLLPPDEFVPFAERTGMIVPLGDFVLRTAVRQRRAWQDEGIHRLVMSVNVSAVQLADDGFVTDTGALLRAEGIDPSQLAVEVTESTIIADVEGTLGRITALRAAGIQVAVDDFGTGQSSLSYLSDFPVDVVKVDRSFVLGATSHERGAALVTGMVRLADAVGARTVVEGVETQTQADVVRSLGCQTAQGFYYSRPMPCDDVGVYLRRWAA